MGGVLLIAIWLLVALWILRGQRIAGWFKKRAARRQNRQDMAVLGSLSMGDRNEAQIYGRTGINPERIHASLGRLTEKGLAYGSPESFSSPPSGRWVYYLRRTS